MILVTGATGHIGNVLVRELLKRGEQVRALTLPGEDLSPLAGLAVEHVFGNVLDRESLRRGFEQVEKVYHLAGIISIMPGNDEMVQRVNVEGTRNVLWAAMEADIRRLVYTSSIHALKRVPHGVLIDENVPFDSINAISAYDRSKAEASLAVQQAVQDGLDAVIACPTGVIGPYDYRGSEMGQVILDAMHDRTQYYVDGAYDFVDVRDVARGLIDVGQKGRAGESYILSGEQVEIAWLIANTQRLAGLRSALRKVPMKIARFAAGFMPAYYRLARTRPRFTPYALETVASNSEISNAKARRELGYAPRPLIETISDTIQWFRENQYPLPVGMQL